MAHTADTTGTHIRSTEDDVEVTRAEEVQRAKYGGFNPGAGLFGWLVAVGVGVVLTALLTVIGGTAVFTAPTTPDVTVNNGTVETVGTVGAILLVIVLGIAYYAGGYVAGRMSRFDGGRQGLGVWVIGIAIAILVAILAAIFGSNYNILQQINFPNVPIDISNLTTGGLVTLIAVLAVTLGAAMLGGKVGQNYHRKVDAVATR